MFKNKMDDELEINGDWPVLEGGSLEELLCSEMWYQGKLEEPANVIYLKVDSKWYRLYFDYGIIFWRKEKARPKEYEIPEYESQFKVVDVGRKLTLLGSVIRDVVGKVLPKGSEVTFTFESGKSIIFSNVEDNTTYRT